MRHLVPPRQRTWFSVSTHLDLSPTYAKVYDMDCYESLEDELEGLMYNFYIRQ